MALKTWLENLKLLHEKEKAGKLSIREERMLYEDGRNQLARMLLSAQHLTLKPGETPRRALRVARALQLDLELPSAKVRSVTIDLSAGGFATLIPSNDIPKESVRYELRTPASEPVRGYAVLVTAQAPVGPTVRASFAFEKISDEDRARIEMIVFESALQMIKA